MAENNPAGSTLQDEPTGRDAGFELPAPAIALLSRYEAWLWVGAVLATVADGLLTYVGLTGGFTEANPVVRIAVAEFGYAGIGLIKAGALAFAVGVRLILSEELGPVVPVACFLPWAGAVVINVLTMTT
jgi:hypothetical protein